MTDSVALAPALATRPALAPPLISINGRLSRRTYAAHALRPPVTRRMDTASTARPQLKLRRIHLDTGRENVVVMARRSMALRPDVFRGFSRVELRANARDHAGDLAADRRWPGRARRDRSRRARLPPLRRAHRHARHRHAGDAAGKPRCRARQDPGPLARPTSEIRAIIDDISHYRYSDMEIAAS